MTTDTRTPSSEKIEADERSDVATWLRVARWAAIAVFTWSVVVHLMARVVIPPVLIIGVIFGAIALFLSGERRKLGLVAAMLAVLAIAGNLPVAVDELSNPTSASAFIPTLLVVTSAAVLAVSGLAAFRGWASEPAPKILIGAGAVLVGGVALAVASAAGVESDQPLASDVEVVTSGIEFEPTQLTVSAGESGFWVDNRDAVRHTFTIRETGQEIDVPAFNAKRAELTFEPGTYEVFCSVPGHENMLLDLTVEG